MTQEGRETLVAKLCTRSTCHGPLDFYQSRGWSRMFWAVITLGSFVAVGFLGYQVIDQYLQKNTATSIMDVDVERMRFPNVTICNPMRHNSTWIEHAVVIPDAYLPYLYSIPITVEDFKKQFNRYLRVSSFDIFNYNSSDAQTISLVRALETLYQNMFNRSVNTEAVDIDEFLRNATFQCREYLTECKFDGQPFDCCQSIRTVFTDNGYCYTINPIFNDTAYYQTSPGEEFGLELTIRLNRDDVEFMSSMEEFGIRLHITDYVTLHESNPIGVSSGVHAHVRVKPIHQILDPDVDSCLIDGKSLTGYDTYTKKICHMACLEDLMWEVCGCGMLFGELPRNAQTACPPLTILQCAVPNLLSGDSDSKLYNDKAQSCFNEQCPRLCNYWTYSTYVMYSQLQLDQIGDVPEDIIKISVFYSDLQYEEYQNQLLTDTNTFISNLGGIVGLWTGISVLSIIQCLAIVIFGPCEDNHQHSCC